MTVEDKTAGMAWAPDAYWDSSKGQYFVHWAAQLVSLNIFANMNSSKKISILQMTPAIPAILP